ncbi:MAG TPA: NADH-quinone oxidoreductase subunit L [Thermoanaerobaculia bacterium]|nr:NADH-quinone oxidoreductase subunit L [Thermoanaerobaculia bacterium]
MLDKLWLIPLTPFLGFLLNGLFGKRLGKSAVTLFAIGTSLAAAILGTIATFEYKQAYPHGERHLNVVYQWFNSGGIGADVAFQLDPLSIVMLMVVTWVGFLIHLYSVGYMHEDEGYWRYFAYLNFFLAQMLILVLGSSYLLMFVGWEGVGLCSYLLIGFYYQTGYAPPAGKKAFIVNRIGDFGFLVAMFLMFAWFGSVDFARVTESAAAGAAPWLITAICLLLFLGATGKSAQIPLFVWLPDAMAGPTPVSALIHAATMVTAGVYLLVRSNALFRMSPTAMMVVATIGALTALFAATIGIRQWDIKKVLAYSTVSQLGFMFIGAGVGAFTGALFHVVTHAFFKACLFLGSGSVIHAMGGEQDIRKMGGLRKHIPITYWTFLIATIAIAGFPPFAGFFSKDEILASAMANPYFPKGFNVFIWLLGTAAAFCTAFYMFRLLYLTFFGEFRGTHEQEHHLHESPWTMTAPLVILAFLSIVGGAILGMPHVLGHFIHLEHFLAHWLAPIYPSIRGVRDAAYEIPASTEWALMFVSTAIAAVGAWIAYRRFHERGLAADEAFEKRAPAIARGMENKWYVDELYDRIVVTPLERISLFFWKIIDAIIDGLAAILGYTVALFGDLLRFFQTGNVRNYALMFFLGVILFIIVAG